MPGRGIVVAVLACALVLPASLAGQSGPRLRAAVSSQSFVAGNYGNTDLGRAVDVAFLFGKNNAKGGFAFEYGEYMITGQPEAVVDASLDGVFDVPIAGGVYMDFRFGINANGWDVGNTRFTVGGIRGGAAVGYRIPFAGNIALDAAVTGSYLYGLWMTTGSNDISSFSDEVDITGARVGARVGFTINPGIVR